MLEKKIFKNKKYLFSIVVIILILITAAIINIFFRPAAAPTPLADINLSNVKTQSYAANKAPEIKRDDKIFGLADAPLKIFVYEDYTNIYSAVLADTLDKIKAESGDKLAIIARPYLVNNSAGATLGAAAVDCAGQVGKWKEMRALLFIRAKNKQVATVDFNSYAKQLGLNENDFQTCLTNEEKSGRIEQTIAEAEEYAVKGAPTIFIGSEMILGARPYADFTDSNGDKIEGLKTVIDGKLKNLAI